MAPRVLRCCCKAPAAAASAACDGASTAAGSACFRLRAAPALLLVAQALQWPPASRLPGAEPHRIGWRRAGIKSDLKNATAGGNYNPTGVGTAWTHNFLNQKP